MSEQSKHGGPSRRGMLKTTAAAGLGLGAAVSSAAHAQTPPNTPVAPVANFATAQISNIAMVVRDAEKVARGFSQIFGASWVFYEFRPKPLVLHNAAATGDCALKVALGYCGGVTFKLIQPVSGSSAYADFLQRDGEGFYSIGLGAFPNHDQMVENFRKAGIGVEMQGDIGDGSKFTVLATVEDLGLRVEFQGVPTEGAVASFKEVGRHQATGPGIVDMSRPLNSGGRRFTQLGIIAKDGRKTAQRYEALLGVGNWRFISIPVIAASLYGKPLAEADLPSATVEQCVAYLGGMQVELLIPVEQKPGGIHRMFLDKHGNGFQHLMVSPAAGDHDRVLETLKTMGITKAFEATIRLDIPGVGARTVRGDYIGMEDQLGGFLLEFNG